MWEGHCGEMTPRAFLSHSSVPALPCACLTFQIAISVVVVVVVVLGAKSEPLTMV